MFRLPKMRIQVPLALSVILSISTLVHADEYDQCKDILRDGVRDSIASNDSVDFKLATHDQFCNLAKKHELKDSSFETFVTDYAKQAYSKHSDNDSGGDVNVIGIVTVKGGHSENYNVDQMSESEKTELLKSKKAEILDYYTKNCGRKTVEQSLKAQATLLSSIANSNIVEAWRACMLDKVKTGFFVEVIKAGSNVNSNDYSITIHWKSEDNNKIDQLMLKYNSDKVDVEAGYQTTQTGNHLKTTADLCTTHGCLVNGSRFPVLVTHKDLDSDALVTLVARTDTGVFKSISVVLPSYVAPKQIEVKDLTKFFKLESYCGNMSCKKYGKTEVELEKTEQSSFILNEDDLSVGTCSECKLLKHLKMCFKNCKYQIKGQMKHNEDVITYPPEKVRTGERYFTDNLTQNFWKRLKITTENID